MEIKLPQESFVHKEIYIPNALYLAQPVGKLACVIFTCVNNKPVCYMLDIRDRQIHKKYPLDTVFDAELTGTIIQGTYLHYESQPCFVIHNIFKYKNNTVDVCYSEKYKLMESIIEQYIFNEKMNKSQCMFFMPVTSFRIENIETSYKIFCIKIMTENKIINYVDQTVLKPFWIHSTDVRDIYEVYTLDYVYHSIAHVDTHKRSVMLNKLFKKYVTLDSIEDSEEEEEFASLRIKMVCKWNEIMKKWVPIKVDSSNPS
jgi:hypothetical protein